MKENLSKYTIHKQDERNAQQTQKSMVQKKERKRRKSKCMIEKCRWIWNDAVIFFCSLDRSTLLYSVCNNKQKFFSKLENILFFSLCKNVQCIVCVPSFFFVLFLSLFYFLVSRWRNIIISLFVIDNLFNHSRWKTACRTKIRRKRNEECVCILILVIMLNVTHVDV